MNKVTKQESSIPIQCRVSLVTLAELARYWKNEKYDIRTVSQLNSWSLYLLAEILTTNGMLGEEMSISEAREYLIHHGLYQKSSLDRSHKKISAAIRFEGLRDEGIEPSMIKEERRIHSLMHKEPNKFTGAPSSVEPFEGRVISEKAKRALEIFNSLKDEDIEPIISGKSLNGPETLRIGKSSKEEIDAKMKLSKEVEDRENEGLDAFLASVRRGKEEGE